MSLFNGHADFSFKNHRSGSAHHSSTELKASMSCPAVIDRYHKATPQLLSSGLEHIPHFKQVVAESSNDLLPSILIRKLDQICPTKAHLYETNKSEIC